MRPAVPDIRNPGYLESRISGNEASHAMTTNTNPPKPADLDLLAGTLALEPHLPGPAELPDAGELPDDADTVADPVALAGLLTGATAMRRQAAPMIEAGAPAGPVHLAVQVTEGYARAVADLLDAVNGALMDVPGARAELAEASAQLARIEQDRD